MFNQYNVETIDYLHYRDSQPLDHQSPYQELTSTNMCTWATRLNEIDLELPSFWPLKWLLSSQEEDYHIQEAEGNPLLNLVSTMQVHVKATWNLVTKYILIESIFLLNIWLLINISLVHSLMEPVLPSVSQSLTCSP